VPVPGSSPSPALAGRDCWKPPSLQMQLLSRSWSWGATSWGLLPLSRALLLPQWHSHSPASAWQPSYHTDHNITEWFGLEGISKPIQPWAAHLPRAPSNLAWSTSRDGAPQLLWAAVPGPHGPLSKEFLPNVYPTFLLFQFKAIPPCPLTVSPCIKSVSRVYCNAAVRSLQTLLQADQAHLP